jgi:hypothetical protein
MKVTAGGRQSLTPKLMTTIRNRMSQASSSEELKPHLVDPQAALDELYRELAVRARCFPRWIVEGRVSRTDAQDRLNRMYTAYELLKGVVESQATHEPATT